MIDFLIDLFGFVFEWLFQWFFGHTGRLLIKGFTFGQVDLDLDRWAHCFLAVIVGLIFWVAVGAGILFWQYPQLVPG